MTDAEMQAQASAKLSLAPPEERPGGIRKVEFVWLSLFAVLLGWHLLDKDVEIDRQVIQERKEQVQDLKAEQHAQIYGVLAKCLNEPVVLRVGDDPVATCKPRKK